MNYHTICRDLMNLGFDGDIQASSDEIKDKATYLYAIQNPAEFIPGEINWPRAMLGHIYSSDYLSLFAAWEAQDMAARRVLGNDYTLDMVWGSEAIANPAELFNDVYHRHYQKAQEQLKQWFYLCAEYRLQDELLTAYTEITASDIYDASIALAEDKWREAV